jgi:hypothetical protein
MADEETPKKRGPKRAIKHTPGRDHDRKSAHNRKKRFARKAAKKRQQKQAVARRAWKEWDALPDDVKRLLGPAAQPKMPRPTNGEENTSSD